VCVAQYESELQQPALTQIHSENLLTGAGKLSEASAPHYCRLAQNFHTICLLSEAGVSVSGSRHNSVQGEALIGSEWACE